MAKDYAKARGWWEKAAAKGDEWAMTSLGSLYAQGDGVLQDYAKAREWYERAAAKDDVLAVTSMGWLYDGGHGVTQDYAKAREWYEKAAAKDDPEAMRNLGSLYANNHGVPQDYAKAREWYEKAAAKGDEWAKLELRLLPTQEAFAVKDYAKAARLQTEIAQGIEKEKVTRDAEGGARTVPELLAGSWYQASWYQLFAKQFEASLASSDRAIKLKPGDVAFVPNHTHSLMFLGREQEARALYLKYQGQRADGFGLWEEVILKDFAEFEKAGLTHPQMDEVRAAFSSVQKDK